MRQNVIGLDENQDGFSPLAEPLLEPLLDEGVFLTFEGSEETLRCRVRGELRDLRRKNDGQKDPNRDHELSALDHEVGEPIQRLLASGHEPLCLVSAGVASSGHRLDSPTVQG